MPVLATIYSAVFGIGLFLGVFHLLIWRKLRQRHEFLFAAVMGVSAGLIGLSEAALLRSAQPPAFNRVFELQNIAIGFMLISMVWFVHQKLGTGRTWLAWAITASWTFFIGTSVFSMLVSPLAQITELQSLVTDWGEAFYIPVIVSNPLLIISELTTLAIILFVLDASIRAWRRGNRRDAFWVGGAILLFIVIAGVQTPLVDRGIIRTPYMISPVFISIAIALTIGLVNDVARNAGLTRQLASERDRWDTLLNAVQLAVARIGADGKISYVNPYFESISGFSERELLGSEPTRLFQPDERAEIRELIDDVSRWTSRGQSNRRLLTKDGKPRDTVWFSVALQDAAGNADGVISFGQDVTEQYAAQAERDVARQELEKLSRALTMGEMASAFAHELSQPIAAVLSSAQTLEILQDRENTDPDVHREILGDIIHETQRARDLMNKVRAFIFDTEPERSRFELGALVGETLEILRHEAQKRLVAVTMHPPNTDIVVNAARTELQQVIINIVFNAIQATEAEDVAEVRVSWRQSEDRMVEITIEDNGPGLPEQIADNVMTAFVTSKESGNGIGLAICRRVARRHGGDIRTAKSPLGGAQFVVSLDILPSDERTGTGGQ